MWEGYREKVCLYKQNICTAKGDFTLNLNSTVMGIEMDLEKYFISKSRTRKNIGLLTDGDGVLTNKDINNAEMFNAFFAFVFNIDNGHWGLRCHVLECRDCGNDKLPDNPRFLWDFLLHADTRL